MKGAADGLMSIVRPISIKRNNKTCIHCRLCDKVCPMNVQVENTAFVRHPNCINCMKCLSVCPKNCIKFGLMNIHFKKEKNDKSNDYQWKSAQKFQHRKNAERSS
jgi:polyferredoxin